MRPAVTKAPVEFLFALVIAATVVGTSFVVKPAATKWVVFGVGVALVLSIAVAALKPIRD
jgi:NADH:ubiquinone oxidoreductase subunit H